MPFLSKPLLLLMLLSPRGASSTLSMPQYLVSSALCTAAPQATQVTFYSPTRGAPPPVIVQGSQLLVSYPAPITQSYYYEATRYNESKCSFCPYSEYPETLYPEYLLSGGVRMLPTPMYGPCLDGMPSTRTACTQNLILYPPDFVGEYFFPEQKLVPPTFQRLAFPSFAHKFIEGSFSTQITNVDPNTRTVISPTLYGLGRQYAVNSVSTFQVFSNGVLNTSLSQQLQAPYLTDSGKEQWPKWEQHFCRPGCHRDSQYQQVTVRPSDYEGKSPTLAYLRRGSSPLTLEKCNKCPPYQAAYNWGIFTAAGIFDPTFPANPLENVQSIDCFPWFGSVPVVVPFYSSAPYYRMRNTVVYHNNVSVDGVAFPTSNSYVQGVPCPQNTYNDVCAHTLLMNVSSPTPPPADAAVAQPRCKPCPPGGFHTNGPGAWFCLPPPGQTAYIPDPINNPTQSPLRNLLNVYTDANGSSLLWARRDILGYEFECGYKPEHCYQCAAAGLPAGSLPDDFNQKVILKNILIWQPCPAGFYCPTALQTPVQCPSALPWSPAGSFSLSQCTCKRGTYLSSSGNGTCQPCAARTACPSGQFMSGWTRCTQLDGATSGGVCTPCTNMPKAYASYLSYGQGIEILNPTNGRYYGFCPFVCDANTILVQEDAGASCLSNYTCAKLGSMMMITNSEATPVYSATALGLRDGIVLLLPLALSCLTQRNLSNALNSAKSATSSSTVWLRVANSCAQVNASFCGGASACFVTRNASYSNNVECAACPQPNSGVFYNVPPPPSSASDMSAIVASYTCAAMCQLPAYYYNATSLNCSSCTSLEQAYCPQGGYHIQGQGCYGDATPFPTLNPALLATTNCIRCALPLPTQPNQWLDLQDPSGCSYQTCTNYAASPALGVTSYIAVPCGKTSNTVLQPCTLTCPKGNYYLQGSCTASTTGVCRQCSTALPGSYIQTNCTSIADTVWSLCTVPGTYCPGDGSIAYCPNNQTSDPGASSALDCYCPVGTTPGGFGTCAPYQCQDSAPSNLGPGAGYVSSFYMALDPSSKTSACVRCPAGSAWTSGNSYFNGVGIEACACSAYNAYMQTAPNRTCTPCSSYTPQRCGPSMMMGPYSGAADTCWQGVQPPACQCLMPPYTVLSPSDTSSSNCAPNPNMCLPGFVYNSDPQVSAGPMAENVTGSSLYAPRQSQAQVWSPIRFSASGFNGQIKSLKSTSDLGGWGDQANWQFIVWTVQEPNLLYVFAAPLTMPQGYNPYQFTSIAWPIVVAASSYSIADIAVAQWPTPQTPAALHPAASTTTTQVAAALISHDPLAPPKLAINTLQVDPSGGVPKWAVAGTILIELIAATGSSNWSVACMGHAYLSSSSAADAGTFFVGGNSVIIAVTPATTKTLTLKEAPLSTAVFMASPLKDGTVWIYASYVHTTTIKLLKGWNPAASPSFVLSQDEADELYFAPTIAGVVGFSVAWPDIALLTPTFVGLARKTLPPPSPQQNILYPQGQPLTIVTADLTQRTFTEIQDLPESVSHPSALTAIPMGAGSLMLLASDDTTTNIYWTLLSMCLPSSSSSGAQQQQFWDGRQCRPHACIRSRPCATNAGQQWNAVSMSCQCLPGYYNNGAKGSLQCILCPAGSFCPANSTNSARAPQSCPAGMTSYSGAQSAQQCTCRDSSFYNYAAKGCQSCPSGSWCPNRWTAMPCPGSVDIARSVAGSQYPKGCVCAPGSVGANCASCPGGANMYCPAGSSAVVNSVAMANVVWLTGGNNDASSTAVVCATLLPIVSSFLINTNIWYLMMQQPPGGAHFYCEYVPAPTPFIKPMVAIMVQTETADAANNLVKSLPVVLGLNSTSSSSRAFVLEDVQPVSLISSPGSVYNNTAFACPTGKVSSDDRTTCVCAPGYETSGLQCSPCKANAYKPNAGTGACIICPTGSFSPVAAAGCSSSSGLNNNNVTASSSPPNVGMIVGLATGGTVVLALVVWATLSQQQSTQAYAPIP